MIEEKDLNKDILKNKINEILSDKKLYAEYETNLAKMSIDNSSTYIYELLKELIKK